MYNRHPCNGDKEVRMKCTWLMGRRILHLLTTGEAQVVVSYLMSPCNNVSEAEIPNILVE